MVILHIRIENIYTLYTKGIQYFSPALEPISALIRRCMS